MNGTTRYVPTNAAKAAARGREADIVRAIGIPWNGRTDHLTCPDPAHTDHNPSWRLMPGGYAVCTCRGPHSVFDVIGYVEGLDFEASKIRVAEILGRADLIVDPAPSTGLTLAAYSQAKRLPLDFLQGLGLCDGIYRSSTGSTHAVRIPYLAADGTELSPRWRVSLTAKKKVMSEKGSKTNLYGLNRLPEARAAGRVLLVGGESDAQTAWFHGLSAIGLPGEGNWSDGRGDAAALDGIPEIFAVIEPDKGGPVMVGKLQRSVIAPRVKLIRMPSKTKDISALYLADPDGFRGAFQRALEAAEALPAQPAETEHESAPIRIVAGDLSRAVDDGEQALIASNSGLYQRGSQIVRPVMTQIPTADGGAAMGYRLAPVKTPHIVECMTRAARWVRFDGRAKDYVATDCPQKIAETYLARDGLWRLPQLAGVIHAPTLRPDGSVLDRPGYDHATGLLFEPLGDAFPPVPGVPDQEDAAEALLLLKTLIGTFPLVAAADTAVALSAICTALIRRSLPSAPLHAFTSPVAGSGKTFVADITSMVATGRAAAVISQGATAEELEKRLGAALLAGDAIVNIDNCDHALGGDLLCQVITQRALKIRVLGQSINIEVPSNATILATGNNLVLTGDMTRRALLCSLDPQCERPELREFKQDPLEVIRAYRGVYVVAALTALRAYHIAGRPEQVTPLGGFVEWSRMVRDALVWLGEADPCTTMEKTRTADPKLGALAAVLGQWSDVLGASRVTLKEAVERASEREDGYAGMSRFLSPDFRDALLLVAGESGVINGGRLGKWLGKNKDRIADGKRIVQDGGRAGVSYWRLDYLAGGVR
jgi:hypothetical protein